MMIASGIVRCGCFTSSPAVETASIPMKEKKITPAAAGDSLNSKRCKVCEIVGVPAKEANDDEQDQDGRS